MRIFVVAAVVLLLLAAPFMGACVYQEGEKAPGDDDIIDDDTIDDDSADDDTFDDDTDDDTSDDDTGDDDISFGMLAAGNYTDKGRGFIWRRPFSLGYWTIEDVFPLVTDWSLAGVSCADEDTCWAAGAADIGVTIGLLLKYDGATWTAISSPLKSDNWTLADVSIATEFRGWAVGSFATQISVLLAWDGLDWLAVDLAWPYSPNGLVAVDNAADGAAIAVGYVGSSTAMRGFAAHTNGGDWDFVDTPEIGSAYSLEDVVVLSAQHAFAIGNTGPVANGIVLEWAGECWQQVTLPAIDANFVFRAISFINEQEGVAVGYFTDSETPCLLVYNQGNWSWQVAELSGVPQTALQITADLFFAGGEGWIECCHDQGVTSETIPDTDSLVRSLAGY